MGQLEAAFAPLIPTLLPALSLTATIDSVLPRSVECGGLANFRGFCAEFFVTFDRSGQIQHFRTLAAWPFWANAATGETSATAQAQLGALPVAPDATAAARYGIPNGAASFNAAVIVTTVENIRASAQENQQARRLLANVSPGGSRWFSGANETLDDPAYSIRVGHVDGVDSIWAPLSHTDQNPVLVGVQEPAAEDACLQLPPHFLAPMGRQADIELTWGDAGTVASVRDITHHLDVPFHGVPQAGWGFVTDNNGNGKIDWVDFVHTPGVEQAVHTFDGAGFCPGLEAIPAVAGTPLVQTAAVTPVSFTVDPGGAEAAANFVTSGNGFGLYINGQQFIFALTGGALPAAGTKWTLRMYWGVVTASADAGTTNPSGYAYAAAPGSPALPGLKINFSVTAPTNIAAATKEGLERVHTVPDPYYVTSSVRADDRRQDHQVRQPADQSDHPHLLVERRAGRPAGAPLDATFGGARETGTCGTGTTRSSRAVCTSTTSSRRCPPGRPLHGRELRAVAHSRGRRDRSCRPRIQESGTMSQFTARRLALVAALLSGLPAPDSRRRHRCQPGQHRLRHHVGRVPAASAPARAGTALGGAFAAIATDVSALYYNPAGIALMARPGRDGQHLRLRGRHPLQLGRHRLPLLGRLPRLRPPDRHLRLRQPAGLHRRPAGRHRRRCTRSARPSSGLTFAQNFSDRFSAGLTAKFVFDKLGEASGQRLRRGLRHQLPRHAERPSDPVRVRGRQPGHQPQVQRRRARRRRRRVIRLPGDAAVPPSFRSRRSSGPRASRCRRSSGSALAYDLIAGETNRLTLLADFNQANNNRAGFAGGGEWAIQPAGRLELRLRPPRQLQLPAGQQHRRRPIRPARRSATKRTCRVWPFGGGLNYTSGNFNLGFDYAYKYLGVLGGDQLLHLSVGW